MKYKPGKSPNTPPIRSYIVRDTTTGRVMATVTGLKNARAERDALEPGAPAKGSKRRYVLNKA